MPLDRHFYLKAQARRTRYTARSPVVLLNRAVALAMLSGPAAGLELIDTLTSEPALRTYHLLPSVRGDLSKKLGRLHEARSEFERAGRAHA
ncbi:MAG: hypothetical protein ABW003_26595 [Microvirga sp.]